jgi:hypothetical protein
MVRKQVTIVAAAALLIAVVGGLFVLNFNAAFAQSTYWEMFCPGRIRATQQNGGYYITCYDPNGTAPTPTASSPTATQPSGSGGSIVVDHNSVALFNQIPSQYLTAARNLKVLFSDRSVGQNFNQSLDCLAASSFGDAPAYCKRGLDANRNLITYTQADYNAGRVPGYIAFAPSPTIYNRSNWVFELREAGWSTLTCDFIQSMAPAHMDKNVLSYQFSYLNVGTGSDIYHFWENNPDRCDIYDLEAFIAQHPNKTFIFWTTSLSRDAGSQVSTNFNNRMRQYARDHNKILFDFADIISYTPGGQPCYDNRDGVSYTSPTNGNTENYPNDGYNYPAICPDIYTTETYGGHLANTSGGRIRVAKAFWVLMAQIAGWRP